MLSTATLCAFLAIAAASPATDARPQPALPKLLVLDFTAAGVPPEIASGLTEAAAAAIGSRGYFQVVTSKDLETIIGLERQKQLLGCSEDGGTCLAELGGALGAKLVLSGSVTKLGPNLQLTIQAIDSSRAQALGRSTRIATDVETLRRSLPYTVAEVIGIPAPAPPSRVLPYGLMGGGAALLIGGAGMGIVGYAQEEAFVRELELGSRQSGILGDAETYRQEASRISTLKTAALAVGLAGLAATVSGFLINPPNLGEGASAMIFTDGKQTAFVLSGVW